MKKYNILFHLVTGRDICVTWVTIDDINEEAAQDRIANWVAKHPFMHCFENGKLEIINMSNVESITVAKAEEEVAE